MSSGIRSQSLQGGQNEAVNTTGDGSNDNHTTLPGDTANRQPAIAQEQLLPAPDDPREGPSGASTQVIFDERFRTFMDGLVAACKKEGVVTAVAIVVDPKIPAGPLVFTHGQPYDIARVMAKLLRQLKTSIFRELDA